MSDNSPTAFLKVPITIISADFQAIHMTWKEALEKALSDTPDETFFLGKSDNLQDAATTYGALRLQLRARLRA